MNAALVFLDTETTGLSLEDDEVWEIAAVAREVVDDEEIERAFHVFVDHDVSRCAKLPEPFQTDHRTRFPRDCQAGGTPAGTVYSRDRAAELLWEFIGDDRPHLIGAVPSFDAARLHRLLRQQGFVADPWHYHLIDVETLVVGWLAAGARTGLECVATLPWDSENLSRTAGVDPTEFARHTAMGDARWAMALYDAVMGGAR